jgi:hypothetical protein
MKCEFLKVEEAKVRSAISSAENIFPLTWIFGVDSRPE